MEEFIDRRPLLRRHRSGQIDDRVFPAVEDFHGRGPPRIVGGQRFQLVGQKQQRHRHSRTAASQTATKGYTHIPYHFKPNRSPPDALPRPPNSGLVGAHSTLGGSGFGRLLRFGGLLLRLVGSGFEGPGWKG